VDHFRINKPEDTSYGHIFSIEKVIFLISGIKLYFDCHSYLVESFSLESKGDLKFPFKVVEWSYNNVLGMKVLIQ
jgi:hypothetical protein